jgi:hypothetical protein
MPLSYVEGFAAVDHFRVPGQAVVARPDLVRRAVVLLGAGSIHPTGAEKVVFGLRPSGASLVASVGHKWSQLWTSCTYVRVGGKMVAVNTPPWWLELATHGWPLVVLLLVGAALAVFGKPLRRRIGKLTKFALLGDTVAAEFDPLKESEFDALEETASATLEHPSRERVEELIQTGANLGWMLGNRDLDEAPVLRIDWQDDGKVVINLTDETAAALEKAFKRRAIMSRLGVAEADV